MLPKQGGEVGGGMEAAGGGNIVDLQVGGQQQSFRQIDSLAVYITHKCLARQGLKDFAEIAGGDKDVPGHGGETQIFVQMLIDIAQRLGDIDLVGGIVLEAAAVGADDLCPGLLEDLPGGKGMGHGLVLEATAGQGDIPGKENEIVEAPVQGV